MLLSESKTRSGKDDPLAEVQSDQAGGVVCFTNVAFKDAEYIRLVGHELVGEECERVGLALLPAGARVVYIVFEALLCEVA